MPYTYALDVVDVTGVDEEDLYGEDGAGVVGEPFSPLDIDIVQTPLLVSTLVDYLREGRIIFDATAHRRPNLWSDVSQSRLIESLMLRIPVSPLFFDYDDESDRYAVIDGAQRLWSIKRFAAPDQRTEQLKLKGLEYLTEYNGRTYDELPLHLRRKIGEQILSTYIVRPGTPELVRTSIFSRVVTGGLPHTSAEIRSSVFRGQAADFLRVLAESPEFIHATGNTVSRRRMADRELVNRFLAFLALGIDSYDGNMDSYLNKAMMVLRNASKPTLGDWERSFRTAMTRAIELFSSSAFRMPSLSGAPGSGQMFGRISKPLFESVSVSLAALPIEEYHRLRMNKDAFLEAYYDAFKSSEFRKALTSRTADVQKVRYRHDVMQRLLSGWA